MGNPTIRYGFIGGILLIAEMLVIMALTSAGVLALTATDVTQISSGEANTLLILGIVTLALSIGTPFVGGLLAARGTGYAGSGAWTGTLAMFLSGLAILVALFFVPLDFSSVQGLPAYIPSDSEILRIHALVALIGGSFVMLARVLFGAILGGIGGLIGRMLYREPRRTLDDDEADYEMYLPLIFPTSPVEESSPYGWQRRSESGLAARGMPFDNWPPQPSTYR